MAKKITLSVPDELHEKMNKWRSSINFSKVFQSTMKNIINKKEGFNKRISEDIDFSDIIERLKKEKEEFENKYKAFGQKLGMEWSKAAHYSDLLYALKWNPCEGNILKDEKLGNYFIKIMSKDPHLNIKESLKENKNLYKFLTGWKESVNQFWSEIKDKI